MVNEDENVNADEDDADDSPTALPKGHLFGGPDSPGFDGGPLNPADVDNPNTLSILLGYRWTTSFQGSEQAKTLSYAFPTMTSDYSPIPGGYPGTQYLDGFAPATAEQQAAAKTAMDLVSSYTDLKFVPATSPSGEAAAIRFANTTYTDAEGDTPSVGNFPYRGGLSAGDVFLNSNGKVRPQYFGTDPFLTVTHELGHALGLTHGNGDNNFPALQSQYTSNEFTEMTYASYRGSPAGVVTAAWDGSAPQSYMMFDIAALQFLYGANFNKVGSSATYSWDANGQEYINGLVAPDTGVTSTHKIFSTVWTQGATTTYDLHNFSDNQVDDLRPGHWLTFSYSQLADLNSKVPAGTPQYQAQGNIYNTLLYHNNTDSEITTLVTGSGNDKIIGNDLDDTLNAGSGNDTIMPALATTP
jgi:serralysin